MSFVASIMNALTEATMDFMIQDPANAKKALQGWLRGALARNRVWSKIETAQRRQRSNIFGLGPMLHNKLAVDA